MSRARMRWTAGSVIMGALGASAAGYGAIASAAPVEPSAGNPAAQALPPGVRQLGNGRYVLDPNTGHGRQRRYQYRYLLPEGWKPGDEVVTQKSGASGMAPADVLAAYSIPSTTSAGGKIVAILDSPDKNAFSDLTAYRSNYKLPALPKCTTSNGLPDGKTPCFAQVAEDGSPSTGGDDPNGDGETGLDMDMISAACPDCAILLVELTTLCTSDILIGVQTAAKLGASATSISLGGPESSDPAFNAYDAGDVDAGNSCPNDTYTTDPMGYTTNGNVVFAASGDFGFDNEAFCAAQSGNCSPYPDSLIPESPSYPSSAPDIVAVGGTTLSGSGSSYSEVVWNGGSASQDVTTSGCSSEFAAVPWQTPLLTATTCKGRATADVAAAADFSGSSGSGISSYSGGRWGQVIGTSAASPMVAAIFTRLGLTTVMSQYIDWPYSNTSAFNDVTSGNDDVSSQCQAPNTILCTAGAGWDGPTGVGSPNGTKLVALSGGVTPPYPTPTAPTQDAGTAPPVDAGSGTADASAPKSDAGSHPTLDGGIGPGHDGGHTSYDAGGTTPPSQTDGGSPSQQGDSGSTTEPTDGGGTGTETGKTSVNGGCDLSGGPTGSAPLGGIAGLILGLAAFATRRRNQR